MEFLRFVFLLHKEKNSFHCRRRQANVAHSQRLSNIFLHGLFLKVRGVLKFFVGRGVPGSKSMAQLSVWRQRSCTVLAKNLLEIMIFVGNATQVALLRFAWLRRNSCGDGGEEAVSVAIVTQISYGSCR